ncbi:MAG: hypothetical protein ACJ8CB_25650 [Ktedonobacteraceae bacterium]
MSIQRAWSQLLVGIVLLLLAAICAGCGSSSSIGSSSVSTATSTQANCFTQVRGTIQSVNGNSLVIANQQGQKVQATYSSRTLFVQQSSATVAELQKFTGQSVTVTVAQNADNTYSAKTVLARSANLPRSGNRVGQGQNFRPCSGFTPGAGFGRGQNQQNQGQRQTILGTLSQINGNSLVVTDLQGSDYTVGLSSATRIIVQETTTISSFKVDISVQATGQKNSSGVLALTTLSTTSTSSSTPVSS